MVRTTLVELANGEKFLKRFSKKPDAGTSTSPPALAQGLQILHEPRTTVPKPVNLIFVHGLGGSSAGTWTHHTTKAFWPALLGEDPRFDNVRIATYGYDANYSNI